jgi:hypothetical protein
MARTQEKSRLTNEEDSKLPWLVEATWPGFRQAFADEWAQLIKDIPPWLSNRWPLVRARDLSLWLFGRAAPIGHIVLWLASLAFIATQVSSLLQVLAEPLLKGRWFWLFCLGVLFVLVLSALFWSASSKRIRQAQHQKALTRFWIWTSKHPRIPSVVLLYALVILFVSAFFGALVLLDSSNVISIHKMAVATNWWWWFWWELVPSFTTVGLGVVGYGGLMLAQAASLADHKLQDAERQRSSVDSYVRQHLADMSQIFDKLGETAGGFQALNKALTNYTELKPKVYSTVANWLGQWGQLIGTLQESASQSDTSKPNVLAIAQVLEVYVQEEMADVQNCILATNLEFYTKLLASLLDPDWHPQGAEESTKRYSFLRMLLRAIPPPTGSKQAVVVVHTVTPALPEHWWNWIEMGQDGNVDEYRNNVKRLAECTARVELPRGDQIDLRIEWDRAVLLRKNNGRTPSKLLDVTELGTEAAFAEQYSSWEILRHLEGGERKPVLASIDSQGKVSFPGYTIDEDPTDLIENALKKMKSLGQKSENNASVLLRPGSAYVVLNSAAAQELTRSLAARPCFDVEHMRDWYIKLHARPERAHFAVIDDKLSSIESAWEKRPWPGTPPAIPRIPPEFTIFGLKWVLENGTEAPVQNFLGIAVPEWDPSRRTMLLELWLPKGQSRPLEALDELWQALQPKAVSGLSQPVTAPQAAVH